MIKSIAKVAQFILGFTLGIALLAGIGAGVAYYFLSRLAQTPPKPLFTEVISQPTPEKTETEEEIDDLSVETATTPEVDSEINTGYRARVTWSQGLTIRLEPSVDSERIGGVYYNQEIIILEDGLDQEWQKVRVPDNGLEGWVKAGNVERVD